MSITTMPKQAESTDVMTLALNRAKERHAANLANIAATKAQASIDSASPMSQSESVQAETDKQIKRDMSSDTSYQLSNRPSGNVFIPNYNHKQSVSVDSNGKRTINIALNSPMSLGDNMPDSFNRHYVTTKHDDMYVHNLGISKHITMRYAMPVQKPTIVIKPVKTRKVSKDVTLAHTLTRYNRNSLLYANRMVGESVKSPLCGKVAANKIALVVEYAKAKTLTQYLTHIEFQEYRESIEMNPRMWQMIAALFPNPLGDNESDSELIESLPVKPKAKKTRARSDKTYEIILLVGNKPIAMLNTKTKKSDMLSAKNIAPIKSTLTKAKVTFDDKTLASFVDTAKKDVCKGKIKSKEMKIGKYTVKVQAI